MSDFQYVYENQEANFGPPLSKEVSGGAHLTFDVVTIYERDIFAFRVPEGIHGAEKGGLYFPHGLIRFGESSLDCAKRLCSEFTDSEVLVVQALSLSSWVDDDSHWHMCFNVAAFLGVKPTPLGVASETIRVADSSLANQFPWWTADQLDAVLRFVRRDEFPVKL